MANKLRRGVGLCKPHKDSFSVWVGCILHRDTMELLKSVGTIRTSWKVRFARGTHEGRWVVLVSVPSWITPPRESVSKKVTIRMLYALQYCDTTRTTSIGSFGGGKQKMIKQKGAQDCTQKSSACEPNRAEWPDYNCRLPWQWQYVYPGVKKEYKSLFFSFFEQKTDSPLRQSCWWHPNQFMTSKSLIHSKWQLSRPLNTQAQSLCIHSFRFYWQIESYDKLVATVVSSQNGWWGDEWWQGRWHRDFCTSFICNWCILCTTIGRQLLSHYLMACTMDVQECIDDAYNIPNKLQ